MSSVGITQCGSSAHHPHHGPPPMQSQNNPLRGAYGHAGLGIWSPCKSSTNLGQLLRYQVAKENFSHYFGHPNGSTWICAIEICSVVSRNVLGSLPPAPQLPTHSQTHPLTLKWPFKVSINVSCPKNADYTRPATEKVNVFTYSKVWECWQVKSGLVVDSDLSYNTLDKLWIRITVLFQVVTFSRYKPKQMSPLQSVSQNSLEARKANSTSYGTKVPALLVRVFPRKIWDPLLFSASPFQRIARGCRHVADSRAPLWATVRSRKLH